MPQGEMAHNLQNGHILLNLLHHSPIMGIPLLEEAKKKLAEICSPFLLNISFLRDEKFNTISDHILYRYSTISDSLS